MRREKFSIRITDHASLQFGGTDWADEKRNSVKDTPSASSSFAFLRLVGATRQEQQHDQPQLLHPALSAQSLFNHHALEGGAYDPSQNSRALTLPQPH